MTAPVRAAFTDAARGAECILVIPSAGRVWPAEGEPKIGVEHPGCDALADLVLDLDAFWCPLCRRNGRISGAWAADMIAAARQDPPP